MYMIYACLNDSTVPIFSFFDGVRIIIFLFFLLFFGWHLCWYAIESSALKPPLQSLNRCSKAEVLRSMAGAAGGAEIVVDVVEAFSRETDLWGKACRV